MSELSKSKMGNDGRANVLPVKPASGPGFLGPNYSPADEMLPPASVGVKRGGDLDDVIGAVKGVIYYGDMMGFGQASSSFTQGMPGLKPLGVNYFMNTGLQCSNGATMWEYVTTIPTGGALGQKVKDAIRGVGLPQLRGMAPGIMEDAEAALNPFPVINAVMGSGYPQCRLLKLPVGDADGKIQNIDGNLLVDPSGLLVSGGRYYQEHWVQDRKQVSTRPGETNGEAFLRGDPIQLEYDDWNSAPKLYRDDGCLADPKSATKGTVQPSFCTKQAAGNVVTLGDGTQVMAYSMDASDNAIQSLDFFQDYKRRTLVKSPHAVVSLTVAALSIMGLIAFWSAKRSFGK